MSKGRHCAICAPTLAALLLIASAIPAVAGYNTVTTVDGSGADVVGEFSSLAIGNDGLPVISYFDASAGALKVAHCFDRACATGATMTTVDDDGALIQGRHNALTIGADGLPVISYQGDSGDTLKVAKCIDIACALPAVITVVDDPPTIGAFNTSIAIGNNGRPVISYNDDALKVARCANPECTGIASVNTVDNSSPFTGYYTSIVIGSSGTPLVSYYDLLNTELVIANCANQACSSVNFITGLADGGEYASMALRFDGIPIISHRDAGSDALMLAQCVNTSCVGATGIPLLETPNQEVGLYSDIAIDASGRVYVSHRNATANSLMVSVCLNSDCTEGAINATLERALPGAQAIGEYSSIAIGNDDLPVISYFDAEAGSLKVAQCATRACDGLFRDGLQ